MPAPTSFFVPSRLRHSLTLLGVWGGAAGLLGQTAAPIANSVTPSAKFPALNMPAPGPATDAPYAPQPILPGGVVVPLFSPGSPRLKAEKVREAEKYTLGGKPGRIQSIVGIHNPSVEIHTVDRRNNTGAVVILVPGGGHNTLNVGTEGSDFVPYFYNYGVNTVILRNRLRADGYDVQKDAVIDALQAVRLVRANAKEWAIDPAKIGIMGFSAGAELAAAVAVQYEAFDALTEPADSLNGTSSRPDFVGLLYPGPTPFQRDPNTKIPANVPPTFIATAGSGDRQHAIWADQYFAAMIKIGAPNLEMHVYGNGIHADGMKDRDGIPFGTWQDRFVDWFRDLGFLGKPGVETRAARDVAAFARKAR